MKRIVSIVPRKSKNTLKEIKQIIHQITLNLGITESRDAQLKTNKRKKIRVEILGDSMLNDIQEKKLNKNADINIKPSLRKEPDQIVIHAGTNDLTNDHNYLK